MTPETDRVSAELFSKICREFLLGEHERRGIGTLGERGLHAILKRFYEQNADFTEREVGRFIADIEHGSEIVEIQTRDFRRLREKLPAYLVDHRVKVVYPIARVKYLRWIDPLTGEMSDRRKSPKKGSLYDFLLELYALRPIIPELREISPDGLSFDLVFVEMDEFKLLTGRSRDRKHFGASRAERLPTELFEIKTLELDSDFSFALPDTLAPEFTCQDFAKAAKLTQGTASRILQTLVTLNAARRTGKRGRAYLYERTCKYDNV